MKKLLLVMPLAFAITGCAGWSDEYACPGMPKGVVCKGTSEVYSMTNDRDSLTTMSPDSSKKKMGEPEAAAFPSGGLLPPLTGPLPVLESAVVARIWIAPWRDQKNDLHWPGYMFTEITPRKWSVGEESAVRAPIIVPLQIDRPVAEPQQKNN